MAKAIRQRTGAASVAAGTAAALAATLTLSVGRLLRLRGDGRVGRRAGRWGLARIGRLGGRGVGGGGGAGEGARVEAGHVRRRRAAVRGAGAGGAAGAGLGRRLVLDEDLVPAAALGRDYAVRHRELVLGDAQVLVG